MNGTIYKIINSVDDKIYIGSTICTLNHRMGRHRTDARNGDKKLVSAYMRQVGINQFRIEAVLSVTVNSREELRILEQQEINKVDPKLLLNSIHAYSHNYDQTRDINKKRKNRRDYYHRHMQDCDWHEKEKLRNCLRMREKRTKEKIFNTVWKELCNIQID